jgi:GNAT superfamily N-acetyltransferase
MQGSEQAAGMIHSQWIGVGHACARLANPVRVAAIASCRVGATLAPSRVQLDRWIRYHIALSQASTQSADVMLTPLNDAIVARLRCHPDRDANQLKSGLRFWDHGLRTAFIWLSDDEPVCIQWLLTADDESRVRTLADWAGMYTPLHAGCGQVENLYTFSTARRKGAATMFEYALFQRARDLGLQHLLTHVHEANAPARAWADRTGWRPVGHITRVHVDLPAARSRSVFIHDTVPVQPVVAAPQTEIAATPRWAAATRRAYPPSPQ